ncbi:MAG: GLPGLI family protein [Bacteroidales bacterium]|nr:GLPGLI family protein [Bacteroidales bacterium]
MKRTILLFIFISIGFGVKAQWWKPQWEICDTVRYVVMYELILKEDTTHLDYYRKDNYMLSIGRNNSVSSFRGYGTYRGDVELKKAGDNGTSSELIKTGHIGKVYDGIVFSVHKFDIFKRYDKRIITTIDHIYLEGMFEYEELFDSFNWQITAETDTINNYICQKAICDFGGRTWVAWFTTEIPISDGPYKFCGLPGLILNIADTENHYSYKFLSIEEPSGSMVVYKVIEDVTKTTKKDFYKLQDKLKISHSIGMSSSNDKAVQRAVEYEMSKNNPIELDR